MVLSFILLLAGVLVGWVGLAGVRDGEVSLHRGAGPQFRFQRDNRPFAFWVCVAFYALIGVGMIANAIFLLATGR